MTAAALAVYAVGFVCGMASGAALVYRHYAPIVARLEYVIAVRRREAYIERKRAGFETR